MVSEEELEQMLDSGQSEVFVSNVSPQPEFLSWTHTFTARGDLSSFVYSFWAIHW